ncbi:hypothetical protein [Methylobacterium radiodurans]|uniref:Uncharacterized protein n=1 Tax=Methylobacterium radiodurans TaxID=2202828 RepID=A0A2U8VUE5_9HYPH|nr:hypothetical protein [Methylobacterium radiodurans]AWN36756.1 hypothetical protein DK427_14285 [Methylobacterium radiodurans]
MRRTLYLAIIAGAATLSNAAFAQGYDPSYTEQVVPQNDRCYKVRYHRQVDLVNPKGILRETESRDFRKAIIYQRGGFARNAYNPAIYEETRTVLSPEYYSMVPTGCGRRIR